VTRIPIPHRKPRTLRERTQARFHAVRHDVDRRWQRLRHRRKHRAAHARMQKLFLQLQHRPHPQVDGVVERPHRPHLRHTKA
jgi:hypothetical protein